MKNNTGGKLLPFLIGATVSLTLCAPSRAQAQHQRSLRGEVRTSRAADIAPVVPEVWASGVKFERLAEIGRGKGVVFSPDLSARSNRQFYERLGFAYFEDASWRNVLSGIKAHNEIYPENPIEILIIESHGTNGNGLKLQAGPDRTAARSYISVGALRESLEETGVRLCVLAACNAGRLLRPRIYHRLDAHTRDPLFLPATLGILNSSPRRNAARSSVKVIYPVTSRLETTNEGDTSEFSRPARRLLEGGSAFQNAITADAGENNLRFVVSDIFMQLLLRDPRLRMKASGYVTAKSSGNLTDNESEQLYGRFLSFINGVAAREAESSHP